MTARRSVGPPVRRGSLPPGTGELLRRSLREDRWRNDVTTRTLYPSARPARAVLLAQARGIVSGVRAAEALGRLATVRVRRRLDDGDPVRPGQVVVELRGDLRRILAVERPMLNLLMHLSGVATATQRAVRSAGPRLEVRGTRKTLPGLRSLEKAAIAHGGGQPHRADLSSGLLVKGPHLADRSIREAVERLAARQSRPGPIEVEVRDRRDAIAAARAGAHWLLIDNASPATARAIVRAVRSEPNGRTIGIEISGGIGLANLRSYRSVGADAVSLGELTHSARALPFHLRLLPLRGAVRRPPSR